jgi:hypothetical protein
MTPVAASDKKNESAVFMNLYRKFASLETFERSSPKFSVGDKVRITKRKKIFEHGYTPRWTEEIFTVSRIQYADPITSKITDVNGEDIQGTFYEQELQKTTQEKYSELKR